LTDAYLSGDEARIKGAGYHWAYSFGPADGLNPSVGKDGVVTQQIMTYPNSDVELKRYSYNRADGLTGIHSSDANHSVALQYDPSGYRMTGLDKGDGAQLQLQYDQDERLIASSDNDGKAVIYSRNAAGKLIAKTTTVAEEISELLYSAGGWQLNADRQPLTQTLSLPGGTVVSIAVNGSEERWQHMNRQGNALLSSDENGLAMAALSLYSPYGEVLGENPSPLPDAPLMGFDGISGIETEVMAIDFTLMGDRIYIPLIHSFTTLDPTFSGGSSPYNYANADPINLHDPSGNGPVALAIVMVFVFVGRVGLSLSFVYLLGLVLWEAGYDEGWWDVKTGDYSGSSASDLDLDLEPTDDSDTDDSQPITL
ncbi:hypothetical protein LCGC14_2482350, partial [marine sediment metagenome]